MNYFKITKKLALVLVASLSIPFLALAANNVPISDLVNFELLTADTAVLVTITADGGGQVTNFDVQSNYIDITLDNLSTVIFRTNVGNRFLKITKQSGSNDYTINPTCPTNVVTLTGTGAQVVLRLEVLVTDNCTVTPPSGGGGGSAPPASIIIGSLKINNGALETLSSNVTLTLNAANATLMAVSNDPNFTGGSWENYTTTKSWSLIPGLGSRIVYVKFKNNASLESIASAAIVVKEFVPVKPVTCQVGCSHLTYDLYIINPDGSERHMDQTRWAKKTVLPDGSLTVNFEDKGLDNNYIDVIVNLNTNNCSNITATTQLSTASWHHQIKLKVFYDGVLKDDLVLWSDSHLALNHPVSLDINANKNICAAQDALGEVKVGPVVPVVPAPSTANSYGAIEALNSSQTINGDKNLLPATSIPLCTSGALIKLPDDGNIFTQQDSAVYYCGANSKRYVFPNPGTYFTWYGDFSKVTVINPELMAIIPLGANVTVRPGAKMVKFTDNKVYAVAKNGVLRWIADEGIARALYGADWNTKVNDLSDAFFGDYTIGDPISLGDVISRVESPAAVTIIPKAPVIEPLSCRAESSFTQFLSLDSNNSEVIVLQKLLQCLGYLSADTILTGHFGSATETAVKDFQTAKGIEAAGYVGPATRDALNKY
jgi:hypothetical protein